MGYICYKTEAKSGCKGCEYYRYDRKESRMACFAQEDAEEIARNTIRGLIYERERARKGDA